MSSSANTPGSQSYDSSPLEPNQLYQGEILVDVPILAMPRPSRWQLLRTRSGRRVEEALQHGNLGGLVYVLDSNQSAEQWQSNNLGDYAMGILDKRSVLVLNQNCDVQHNQFLQVAPIYSAGAENRDLEGLRNGEIFSAFWVPRNPPEIPD